jgi:hypothetical protein
MEAYVNGVWKEITDVTDQELYKLWREWTWGIFFCSISWRDCRYQMQLEDELIKRGKHSMEELESYYKEVKKDRADLEKFRGY